MKLKEAHDLVAKRYGVDSVQFSICYDLKRSNKPWVQFVHTFVGDKLIKNDTPIFGPGEFEIWIVQALKGEIDGKQV